MKSSNCTGRVNPCGKAQKHKEASFTQGAELLRESSETPKAPPCTGETELLWEAQKHKKAPLCKGSCPRSRLRGCFLIQATLSDDGLPLLYPQDHQMWKTGNSLRRRRRSLPQAFLPLVFQKAGSQRIPNLSCPWDISSIYRAHLCHRNTKFPVCPTLP